MASSIASCVAISMSNTHLYVSLGGVADVLTRHCHARHDDVQLTLEINFKERERQPPGYPSVYVRVRAHSDRLCILAPNLDKLTNRIAVCEFAGRDHSSPRKLFCIPNNAHRRLKMAESNGDIKGSYL